MRTVYRAFTLVEILIVLIIIAILFLIVMQFGTQRIVKLSYQTAKEAYINNYESVYSAVSRSSFVNGVSYRYMDIVFTSGSKGFSVAYIGQSDDVPIANIVYPSDLLGTDALYINESHTDTIQSVVLRFQPYVLGCSLGVGDTWYQEFSLVIQLYGEKQSYQYCMEISSGRCMIAQVACE